MDNKRSREHFEETEKNLTKALKTVNDTEQSLEKIISLRQNSKLNLDVTKAKETAALVTTNKAVKESLSEIKNLEVKNQKRLRHGNERSLNK